MHLNKLWVTFGADIFQMQSRKNILSKWRKEKS